MKTSVVLRHADEAVAAAAARLAEEVAHAEAVTSPVVICGFGELGQTIANMLDSPAARSSCEPVLGVQGHRLRVGGK